MSAGPFIVTVTFTDEGGQSVTTSTGAGTASTVTVSAPAATPNSVSGNLPFAAATYYQGGYILSFVARGLSGTPNYSGNLNYQDTPGSFSITGVQHHHGFERAVLAAGRVDGLCGESGAGVWVRLRQAQRTKVLLPHRRFTGEHRQRHVEDPDDQAGRQHVHEDPGCRREYPVPLRM
jgi:hypothetical protein